MRPNFTFLSCRRAWIALIKEQCWGFPIRTLNGCGSLEDVREGGTDRRPGRKQGGISPAKDVFGAPKAASALAMLWLARVPCACAGSRWRPSAPRHLLILGQSSAGLGVSR